MRIYELAKELDCNSNDIKDILDELKITYKTHSSSIPDEMVSVVKEKFLNKGSSVKVDKVENIEIEKAEKATKEKAPAKSKKIAKVESKSEDKKTEKKDSKPVIDEILPVSADEDIKDLTSTYVPWIEEEEEKDFEREVKRKKFKKHVDKDFSEKPEKNIKDLFIDKHEKDEKEEPAIIKEKPAVKPKVFDGMTLKELSECISISSSELIKKLFMMGVMASINKSLDIDTILIIADELKIEVEVEEIEKLEEIEEEKVQEVEKVIQEEELAVPEEYLEIRPPVVTIMGHVNHGKTTLLDSIRKSKIVDTESGGITQHIGAYIVEHKKSKICFIDTPGHAAFTNMRAMGANVTDIVVLIVAANDGIQPQTLESINHAKEAAVPIIVAINKIDIDGIGVDKIKADLSQHGLTPEDWGGECLCVPISAIKGQGIEELLDAINLQAELLELKANPKGKAFGIVLESCQTDQQGPLVTVLVKNGVFKVGDPILCAHVYGKIKRMENDKNEIVEVATPSMPVRIFGFSEVPDVSSRVIIYDSEKEAKEIAKEKTDARRNKLLHKKENITIDNIYSSIQAESKKEFKIILKADVVGSITAIKSLFASLPSEKVKLKMIHAATGAVSDTDIMFANAYNAIIIAYRVRIASTALSLAKQHNVKIKDYDVIYHIYDFVQKSMEGLLDHEYIETEIGKCEVKKLFKIGRIGVIAGCLVINGKVLKNSKCRIRRNGELLEYEGKITSLKHYKDEVNEVRMGIECGISLDNFNKFEEGDILEFHILEKAQSSL